MLLRSLHAWRALRPELPHSASLLLLMLMRLLLLLLGTCCCTLADCCCLQVATIHDLIIHPDLQGFGLGSTLMRRLVAQISDEDVWDVGTVTPSHLQPFFRTVDFELDRENSVPMTLSSSWTADIEQINRPLQANSRLTELLQRATLDKGR